MNRAVELSSTPKKIISLVPSQTELLFDLGLDNEIAGITKFCTHPAIKVKQKAKVGGTKTLDIHRIKKINPDLIIGNKEENERAQIEELMPLFPVWMSDIADLPGAVDMIHRVGEITGKASMAAMLIAEIQSAFALFVPLQKNLKVAYLIWRKPFIVAGRGTFIDAMLQQCGLANAFDQERYPEITPETLAHTQPDLVFLSSEPYPFREKHIKEFQDLLPDAVIKLVDGELFSWYGSRLRHAPAYFSLII